MHRYITIIYSDVFCCSRPHSMPCTSSLEYPGIVNGTTNHTIRYSINSPRPLTNRGDAVTLASERLRIGSPRSYSALARTGRALMANNHDKVNASDSIERSVGDSSESIGAYHNTPASARSHTQDMRGGSGRYLKGQQSEDESFHDLDLSKYGL